MKLKMQSSACIGGSISATSPILRFLREMATDKQMLVRRLREGGEFFGYLRERKETVRARHHQLQPQA